MSQIKLKDSQLDKFSKNMCICLFLSLYSMIDFLLYYKESFRKNAIRYANKFNVQKTSFFLNYRGQSDFLVHCPSGLMCWRQNFEN